MRHAYKHSFLLASFLVLCACGPDASNPGGLSPGGLYQALVVDGVHGESVVLPLAEVRAARSATLPALFG